MNINLHIGQLVLEGLPLTPAQGRAVQIELAGELTRLLEERGIGLGSGAASANLSLAPFQLSPDGPPSHWGRQLARSLFAGLAPPAPALSAQRNARPEPPSPHSRNSTKSPTNHNQPTSGKKRSP